MLIIGDVHITAKEPYKSSLKKSLNQISKIVRDKLTDKIFFTGDFFHTGHPYPSEVEMARDFLASLPLSKEKVFIVAGNHDFSFKNGREECALDTISDMATIIKEPGIVDEDVYALPFFYRRDGKSIYEFYTPEFLETVPPGLIVIGHFFSENLGDFSDAIKEKIKHVNLSPIRNRNRIVLGHDHTPRDEYLGSVIPTEFSPDFVQRRILEYVSGGFGYIPLDRTIDFKVLEKGMVLDEASLPTYVKVKTESRTEYEELRNQSVLQKNVWIHSVEYVGKESSVEVVADTDFENAHTLSDRMAVYLSGEGADLPDGVKAKLVELVKGE